MDKRVGVWERGYIVLDWARMVGDNAAMKRSVMKQTWGVIVATLAGMSVWGAEGWPENLVADGMPPISAEVRSEVARYLDFRAAAFQSWHPKRREMLITTRFAETAQLHLVRQPGGARKQLTFLPEPVAGGSWQPKHGRFIIFSQDVGGGEFYQLYRFDPEEGRIELLTDGKSRNMGARWSRSGQWLAYSSTRRNGRDTDIYVMDPEKPGTERMVMQVEGGGWSVTDWSHDESRMVVTEYVSINESHLHLVDVKSGKAELITEKGPEKVSYAGAEFSRDGKSIYVATDKGSEFKRLTRIDLGSKEQTVLTKHLDWDVESFELSPDGKTIAFVTNEDGVSVLHLMEAKSGKELSRPQLPMGVIGGVEWNETGGEIAFTLSSARSPSDAYSYDVRRKKLERWTESETSGLNAENFVEPQLVKFKSFDGTQISAFYYAPDAKKFPGKRPVLVSIHGGPESQVRPGFQARMNFFVNEMGIALITPNVRGSAGYGKTFLQMDNGFKREDSVKDIGALLDWIGQQPGLDKERIAVIGGSYGGYMVLASMTHFNDRLRAGVDIVGISNFLTFLKNTQDYRRDLRRVEYGDERDEKMREFLEKSSPSTNVRKITKPLFVVQGKNDPRVPASESEQMVKAIRENKGKVWYLLGNDEGHGFAKKKNQDAQFMATVMFLREHLLE